jgi:hypothetical protein
MTRLTPHRPLTPEQVRERIRAGEMRLRPRPSAEEHERFIARRRGFEIRMEMLYEYMRKDFSMPMLAKASHHYGWSEGPVTRANIHLHIKKALKWVMEHAWFEVRK